MTSSAHNPAALAQQLESAFLAGAQKVDGASGEVHVARLELEPFIEARFGADWYFEVDDFANVDDFLRFVTGAEPECLVEWMIVSSPMGGLWYMSAFRIGERGYIYAWNEPDAETGQPVLASWAPYDSRQSFEDAFVAAVAHDFSSTGPGEGMRRGPRVSLDLLERAVWTALQEPAKEDLLGVDIDLSGTDCERRDSLRQFLEQADRSPM